MNINQIKPSVRYVGVNDRTTTQFEALWSLPYGVSYNSYLVVGEKVALIDTVEVSFVEDLLSNIKEQIGDRPIDYLVVNHMEPDHSSSIKILRSYYPNIEIVGNAKTAQMLDGYYGLTSGILTIKDGEELDLGQGKSLKFYLTPMVHWPETMMTWFSAEGVLFSGDAFGSFGALNGGVVDSQLTLDHFWDEMRRYYACIVGKYGTPVQNALKKLKDLPIEMICSTHGPIWSECVGRVVGIYDKLSRYEAEPGVVIAYGSMYGNTAKVAERIAKELASHGEKQIIVHNLSIADPSHVIRDIFKYDTLVIGSPTYNGALFPRVEALVSMIEARGIPSRKLALFGSFTWAGAAVKHLTAFTERMKWELLHEPIEMKCGFDDSISALCHDRVKSMK